VFLANTQLILKHLLATLAYSFFLAMMSDHKNIDVMRLEEVPTACYPVKSGDAVTAYRSRPADEVATAEKKLLRKLDLVSPDRAVNQGSTRTDNV